MSSAGNENGVERGLSMAHCMRCAFSLPTAMSDDHNINDETCFRLITYDGRYLGAQNVTIDL